MKIRGNEKSKPLEFKDLENGETFTTPGAGDVLIKVGEVGENPNAIDLKDGSWMMFKDEEVVRVNAEIVIVEP